MALKRLLGTVARKTAAGSNLTVNLARFALGAGDWLIPANTTDGRIRAPTHAPDSSRALEVILDNRQGSADAYLIPPDDLPNPTGAPGNDEAAALTATVIPSGEIVVIEDRDLTHWTEVLRLLNGASVVVTVYLSGAGLD